MFRILFDPHFLLDGFYDSASRYRNMKLSELQQYVEDLRQQHVFALSAFHGWEELEIFRSVAEHGELIASQNTAAYCRYTGFFSTAQSAMQTQCYISFAKIFVGNSQSLTIRNLLKQIVKLDENQRSNADTVHIDKKDVSDINRRLDEAQPTILRLKALRDKLIAHLDMNNRDVERLTRDEMMQLMNLSNDLLNMFSLVWGNAAFFGVLADQVTIDTRSLLDLVAEEYRRLNADLL